MLDGQGEEEQEENKNLKARDGESELMKER